MLAYSSSHDSGGSIDGVLDRKICRLDADGRRNVTNGFLRSICLRLHALKAEANDHQPSNRRDASRIWSPPGYGN